MSTMYFFDDRHISSMSGLMRVPGPVAKLGPVFGSVDPKSDFYYDPFAGTIMPLKEGGYRAYVSTFGYKTKEPTRGVSVLESKNGVDWSEAKLDFSRKEGLNPGRIKIDGLPDGFQGYFKQPQVIRLEHDVFRMYVWCHGFLGRAAIGRNLVCESKDGYQFKILDFGAPVLYHPCEFGKWGWEAGLIPMDFSSAERPALAPEKMLPLKGMRSNDSVSVYYDPVQRLFIIYSVFLMHNPAGNPRQEDRDNARTLLRVITRRESADGFRFSDPELIITPDENDPLDQQFYYLAVHRQDGWNIGFLGDFEIIDQTMDAQLCFSRDGLKWERPCRSSWIPRQPGAFDSLNLYAAAGLIDAGEDWLVVYRGGTRLHRSAEGSSDRELCIAAARFGKRRFLGLDTGPNRDSRLLTRGFILTGPEIKIDADIRGDFRAELCDVFGAAVPGYRREDFVPVKGDSRQHILRWKDKETAGYRFDPAALRLEMADTTLYAIQY